ncbi:hypothetical protein [Chryseobacterium flavum]|uniref:hypothetical protein n=1 Tax=Chryseobacterium flavum TaxID=415851 RepID=UPI0028A8B5C0|nr:hypothetical protein [Chryseobacterium flavum]
MRKINNFKVVNLLLFLLTGITVGIAITIIYTKAELEILLILFIVLFVFTKIRYFEFEYSRECICIRDYHPLFKKNKEESILIEFPASFLRGFEIEKKLFHSILILTIDTRKERDVPVRFKIFPLGAHSECLLLSCLDDIQNKMV